MTTFLAGFFYVFLLGLQQQHITARHHGWSIVTSFALALVLAAVVRDIVQAELWLFVLQYGSGSALGASLSMIVHPRLMLNRGVIGDPL